MADGFPITPGTGEVALTDEVTVGGVTGHAQFVKLLDGTLDGNAVVPATGRGLAVDPHLSVVRLLAVPPITTSPYAAGDVLGGVLTFNNAVRTAGGTGRIDSIQITDAGNQRAAMDLIFFDRAPSAPTDSAALTVGDSELGWIIGRAAVTASDWVQLADNAFAHLPVGLEMVLNGTNLYGILVSRGTPTYAAGTDLTVYATVIQN